MIVHIVMFKFKTENKDNNINMISQKLSDLENKIDILNSIEVGINFNESDRAFDLSLYSTFKGKEELKEYATHEEHLKVLALIKEVTLETKVVDYILNIN